MGNMKEGDSYECGDCGLVVDVMKACDEEQCDLMCCSQQMTKSS